MRRPSPLWCGAMAPWCSAPAGGSCTTLTMSRTPSRPPSSFWPAGPASFPGESIAGWLHETAFRVACKARGERGRRQTHQTRIQTMTGTRDTSEASWQELCRAGRGDPAVARDLPRAAAAVLPGRPHQGPGRPPPGLVAADARAPAGAAWNCSRPTDAARPVAVCRTACRRPGPTHPAPSPKRWRPPPAALPSREAEPSRQQWWHSPREF